MSGLIAIALLFIGGITLVPEIQRHRVERAEIARLEREVQNREVMLTSLKKELRLLQSDPGYVEMLARDRLDLMREGETIFRLDTPGQLPR